jgi:hypothetical protein
MSNGPLPRFLFAAAFSVSAALAWGAPRIECDGKTRDFGVINTNTQALEHTFVLWNSGDSDLVIAKVQSSCGCTTANVGENSLKPGTSTSIKARFTLNGRKGVQRKDITVVSNDQSTPELALQVACDIRLSIDTDASGFFFGRMISASQTVSRTVNIRAASNVVFTVTSVDGSAAPSVTLETTVVETGRAYAVTATVKPDSLSSGMIQERVTVHTDHHAIRAIDLPVTLYKTEEVGVLPNDIPLLDAAIRQAEVRREMFLRITGTNKWEFFDVEPEGDFKVRVEEMSPTHCRIVLSGLSSVDEAGTSRLVFTVRNPATGAERQIHVRLRRYIPKRTSFPRTTVSTNRQSSTDFRDAKMKDPVTRNEGTF